MGDLLAVVRPTFEQRLERYTGYLRMIAHKYAGNHPYSADDDIFQELSIVLWKCHQRYVTETTEEFHNLFVTGVMNQISNHYRVRQIAHDKEMVRIDAKPRGGKATGGIPGNDAYPLERAEESEDFYRAGIFELINELSPETAKCVMEALDPNNRGPMHGRNKAYLEVKNLLDGV